MCGIFGMALGENAALSETDLKISIEKLLRLSESRGREAVGLAATTLREIIVAKRPLSATAFIKSNDFKNFIGCLCDNGKVNGPFMLMGHCRLVTDGGSDCHDNNQPVIDGQAVGVHNGIIVNAQILYRQKPQLKRKFQVDTEVVLDLFADFRESGHCLSDAITLAFREIRGTAAMAMLFEKFDCMAIVTNYGSLYYGLSTDAAVFASEEYILRCFCKARLLPGILKTTPILPILPRQGFMLWPQKQISAIPIYLDKSPSHTEIPSACRAIRDLVTTKVPKTVHLRRKQAANPALLRYDEATVRNLLRCTRCILPSTFPYISFDEKGVCNYCRSYLNKNLLGEKQLLQILKYRNGQARKILMAFSGGRDSCYALHYLAGVQQLPVIAYTYDWGAVTDLARRNMSRLCEKLSIEHIIVSADIAKKRENIRLNVLAWLRKPHLGMIPLFMAGDKQFFFYANKIMSQTGRDLLMFAQNSLERTDFKTGFATVGRDNSRRWFYQLNSWNQLKLIAFYVEQFFINPSYLNRSLFDTAWAYFSYYIGKHDYTLLYDYLPWQEEKIVSTLIRTYDWETDPDYRSTWRIGDGTSGFYNYIYCSFAGFTENDTFRSNQIREGLLSRDTALDCVVEENHPRFNSIVWYCDTMDLDYTSTIQRINESSSDGPLAKLAMEDQRRNLPDDQKSATFS